MSLETKDLTPAILTDVDPNLFTYRGIVKDLNDAPPGVSYFSPNTPNTPCAWGLVITFFGGIMKYQEVIELTVGTRYSRYYRVDLATWYPWVVK